MNREPLVTVGALQDRKTQLEKWLEAGLSISDVKLHAVVGDASFRRYFRFMCNGRSYIAVDAPPEHENCRAFVALAVAYAQQDIGVPQVILSDFELGFMCLSDLGDQLLLDHLNGDQVDNIYRRVLDILPRIAKVITPSTYQLPSYNRAMLQRELGLFSTWFLEKHLQLQLSSIEKRQLDHTVEQLITSALVQPQVGVHRDFHARNIMVGENDQLAVIDFQDAVIGPITYDAVSILRDCYVRWPDELVYELLLYFKEIMGDQYPELEQINETEFVTWFDWMGIQRHMKVCGIFSRLYYRDDKDHYLADLPTVVSYLLDVAKKYTELSDFVDLLNCKVLPAMEQLVVKPQQSAAMTVT